MRSYTFEGVVIKRLDFGEADKLLTFFTKELGKVTLVGKGLRRLSSKRAGSVELFNQVRASAVPGRGSLDTLTEVQLLDPYTPWRKHLGRVNVAYQLCEVIDKLLPERQSHPQVYDILSTSLSQISNLDENWRLETRNWILDIAKELGYWPENQEFTGDIHKFIESLIQSPIHSPKMLHRLSSK